MLTRNTATDIRFADRPEIFIRPSTTIAVGAIADLGLRVLGSLASTPLFVDARLLTRCTWTDLDPADLTEVFIRQTIAMIVVFVAHVFLTYDLAKPRGRFSIDIGLMTKTAHIDVAATRARQDYVRHAISVVVLSGTGFWLTLERAYTHAPSAMKASLVFGLALPHIKSAHAIEPCINLTVTVVLESIVGFGGWSARPQSWATDT